MHPGSKNQILCNGIASHVLQRRFKTATFKPKIARNRPLKNPSALALDHFDFYYGPMFGKRWPSIRLGLLSPNKYVAIVNTFSRSWQSHEDVLKHLGTFNLLEHIKEKTKVDRIEEDRKIVLKKGTIISQLPSRSNEVYAERLEKMEIERFLRSAAGISEFREPQKSFTTGELHLGEGSNHLANFEVTGYEGQGFQLDKREHVICYPEEMRVLTYGRDVIADFPSPLRGANGVPSWWLLDGGSVVPVLAAGLERNEVVLDMCAAPGGKSLLMLLTGLPGKLICNDVKLSRLGQLKRALSTYIPHDSLTQEKVVLKRKDASSLSTWDEHAVYDKVIADVPCSTDRLAVNQDEGNLFSLSATNERLSLPQLQTKILVNAIRSAKIGGSIIYSTCTLSALQNEAVVENAASIVLQNFGIKVVEESLHQLRSHLTACELFRFVETPSIGITILPFIQSNFGPMYVCKLSRLS